MDVSEFFNLLLYGDGPSHNLHNNKVTLNCRENLLFHTSHISSISYLQGTL